MAMHPSKAVSQYQTAELLNIAYSKCATVGVACKAFTMAEIKRHNRCIFTATDFVGALVTDKIDPSMAAVGNKQSSVASSFHGGEASTSISVPVDGGGEISLLVELEVADLNGNNSSATVLPAVESDGPLPTAVSDRNNTVASSTSNTMALTSGDWSLSVEGLIAKPEMTNLTNNYSNGQSSATATFHVSPSPIKPSPKKWGGVYQVTKKVNEIREIYCISFQE